MYHSPLIDSGVASEGRFLFTPLKPDGTTVRADKVYTVVNSHYSNVMSGDAALRLARDAFAPAGALPISQRSHVLLVERPGRSRRMLNRAAVTQALRSAIAEFSSSSEGSAHAESVRRLQLLSWRADPRNVSADLDAWRRAAVVVAAHGAGLSNMLFASEGTPVIEVCYDDNGNANTRGMLCPAMYASMASNLGLPYWVTTGAGTYGTPMTVDLAQLRTAAMHALRAAYRGRRAAASAASEDRGRGPRAASKSYPDCAASGTGRRRDGASQSGRRLFQYL